MIYGPTNTIGLPNGEVAVVGEEDFGELSKYKWHTTGYGYAVRHNYVKGIDRRVYMHREVMGITREGVKDGRRARVRVDHINGDRLDNRRSNLRFCTQSQNRMNSIGAKGSSRYKGVTWSKARLKWAAQIKFNGKHITGGLFSDELLAAKAYDRLALRYFGEFAKPNFKPGDGI